MMCQRSRERGVRAAAHLRFVMLLHALEIRSLLGIGSWMGRCGVEGEYFFWGVSHLLADGAGVFGLGFGGAK